MLPLHVLVATLTPALAEGGEQGGEVNPYLIGVVFLLVFAGLMGMVLAIGKGREHS